MLEGIKIISPSAIWLAPLLLATLLYIYRRGGRGASLSTPTLVLLRKLRSKPQLRNRIMPPWRFFLELLLGLLLILGISQLSSTNPQSVKIIIDNSLSMASLQVDGRSRLFAAKKRAASFIEDLPSSSDISLFITSPKIRQIPVADLKNIEAVAAPDLLAEAVERFIADNNVQKIGVFTDKKLLTPIESERLTWDSLPPRNDGRNFAFKNISFNPIDNTITASITLFSNDLYSKTLNPNDHAQAKLKLETNYGSYEVLRVVEERSIKLSPETTLNVVFSGIDRDSNIARLSLSSLDVGAVDDNPLDNVAYLALDREAQITLVSNFDRKDLGVDKLGLPIRTVTPEIWERSDDFLGESNKGVIFHRYFPKIAPKIPVIAILPPSTAFAGEQFSGEALISSWKQPHPLTRYINLQSLKLNQGRVFQTSNTNQSISTDAIEPIISSERGPILAIDTSSPNRTALVGFELLPFRGSSDLTISILTLNLLNWSFEKSLNSGSHHLFDRIKLAPTVSYIASPEGEKVDAKEDLIVDKVGVWRAFGSLNTSNPYKFYAVNYFSDAESDILHPTELSIAKKSSVSSDNYASLLGWLAGIALFILLLDSLHGLVRTHARSRDFRR